MCNFTFAELLTEFSPFLRNALIGRQQMVDLLCAATWLPTIPSNHHMTTCSIANISWDVAWLLKNAHSWWGLNMGPESMKHIRLCYNIDLFLVCSSCLKYRAVPLEHHFFPKSSQETPHSLPMRARYGVSFMRSKCYWCSAAVIALL